MFKNSHIISKTLVLCLLFTSVFIIYDFFKTENFVVKEIETVNDTKYFTLKSNKTFKPSVERILARVDEDTVIINEEDEKSSIEKGTRVIIEYEMGTLSNPPIVQANKMIIISP